MDRDATVVHGSEESAYDVSRHRPGGPLGGLNYDAREAHWHTILADQRQSAFVAETPDGRIVGCFSGGPERSGGAWNPAELYTIHIDQPRQRPGLGLRLTAAPCTSFLSRGWQSMLLWVLAENPPRASTTRWAAPSPSPARSALLEIAD